MAQQTAVDWLEQEFLFSKEDNGKIEMGQQLFDILITKAKQMEKEQIMKAVYDAMGTNFDPNMGRAEQYYNEKYGK
jgi:hypothetical protein